MNPNDNPVSMDQQLIDQLNHANRHLAWKLKTMGKQLGKAGATIYALRTEVAYVREAGTFNAGDRARMWDQIKTLRRENRELKDKLRESNRALLAERGKAPERDMKPNPMSGAYVSGGGGGNAHAGITAGGYPGGGGGGGSAGSIFPDEFYANGGGMA